MRLSRRSLLGVGAGFVLPELAWARSEGHAVLCWKLDGNGDTAREQNSASEDTISSRTGHATWLGEGRDRALRLDGYSVWVQHAGSQLSLQGPALTVTAWVALESYPVNEAAVLEQGKHPDNGFRLTIDRFGHLSLAARLRDGWAACKSESPVPRSKWVHLAATLAESGEIGLYLDAKLIEHGASAGRGLQLANDVEVIIGKAADSPIVANVFPTGVLNGLIKDVRVFDGWLSGDAISKVMEELRPGGLPDLAINGHWCVDDKQRPVYHALPPRAWTNEPHGLIHWGGQFHIFYQKNANGPYWGHINWGHMTSPDLYRWTEIAVALSPEPGPDSEGCWSGSVIDHDGKLTIIYTGGNGSKSSICLAYSTDGVHFTKYPGNPIIPAPPQGFAYPEFRDPFVWREGDWYHLIIGSAITDVGGTALLYRSKDLIRWEYLKPLLVGDRETSGVFWEMPIFVKAGDRHALIVCEVPGRASYWVGKWDGETFTPHTSEPRRLELFNHLLSPTPYIDKDGQVIAMGIIPDQRSPKECWRAGWAHLYSLPRVISTTADGHLCQRPLEGIEKWSEDLGVLENVALMEGPAKVLDNISGTRLHIRVTFKRGESEAVLLIVRGSSDGREKTEIRYEWAIGRLVLDRSQSSLDPNVKRDIQEAAYFPKSFPGSKDKLDVNVFLDESVIEVFLDGKAAFASRIYPTLSGSDGVAVGCRGGGAQIEKVTAARMRRPS